MPTKLIRPIYFRKISNTYVKEHLKISTLRKKCY